MILLTTTSSKLQVVTGSTQTIDVHASYIDNNSGVITPGSTNTAISSATTTDVVAAPGSGVQRNIKYMVCFNNGSGSETVKVQHTDGSTVVPLFSVTLQAGECIQYTEGDGWEYMSAAGVLQTNTQAIFSASANFSSASPTGGVSTTEKAMGLGATFTYTPTKTGNLIAIFAGMALNSTAAGDGTTITGRQGTGTAPVNGATSGLGTSFGLPQHFVGSTTAGQQGFVVMGKITGLALNTPVWFDLSLLAVTGGGSTIKDVQFIVIEA